MNKLFKSALYISTALTVGATAPVVAQAATTTQANEPSIEQVIVTATRREERLQDVPISISVFNQEQLANKNVTTASQLATYTPSLSADTRFGSDNSSFAIRGFTQEIRTTPSVGVYFADVVALRGGGTGTTAGDGAGPGAFFDLQNVQVLKGPQGTLFGRNTTGGAILIVPQKPTPMFGGYIEGSVGNYNMKRIQGVLNVPLNDKVWLRLGVDHESRDGYLKNTTNVGPSRFGNVDYTALRASVVYNITPDLENYTVATYSKSDNNGSLQQVFACDPHSLLGGFGACNAQAARQNAQSDFWTVENSFAHPQSMIEQWQVMNHTTWHVSDNLTVKNIISYGQFKSILRGSIFGDNFTFAGYPLSLSISNPPPGHVTNDQSTFTEELQFQGTGLGDKLTWQAGLYTEMSNPLAKTGSLSSNFAYCPDVNSLQCVDTFGPALAYALSLQYGFPVPVNGGGASLQMGTVRYRDYAAYGQATYSITDKLKATAGIRYTYDHTTGWGQAIVYNFPTPFVPVASCPAGSGQTYVDSTSCQSRTSQNSRAPTWLLQLQYTPVENAMLYAKWARGYRQGAVSPDSPPGFESFKQEKVDTYEIGAKTSWDGMIPGAFDFAAFYNDFSNQQLQFGFSSSIANLAAAPTTGIVNAGQSRIWGVEANTSISPFEGLQLSVGYSYLNSLLQKFDLAGATALAAADGLTATPTSLAGYPLPFTPEHKVTLSATYKLPIPDTLGALSVGASYVYSGSYYTSVLSPYGKIPPSRLLNMNLNWIAIGGSQFDGSIFVTNLLNAKYATFVPGLYTGYGFESRAVGEPRMFGIRLRYNFD